MTRGLRSLRRLLAILLLAAAPLARAHVGSKDVFENLQAGPYKLFVTVRLPNVIPGIATVDVEAVGDGPDALEITPTPLTGEASRHPPTADRMVRDARDPRHYTGALWIMARGSWEVRFHATGTSGEGNGAVPVAAVAIRVLPMPHALGWLLAFLALVLMLGFAGLIAAAVHESRLVPGAAADGVRQRRGARAFATALLVAVALVAMGGWWWHREAVGYAAGIFKPSELRPTLEGNRLHLAMGDADPKTGAFKPLATEKLLLDHGKPMHLYAIRWPAMDAAFHLHPVLVGKGQFAETLPAMPPGTYKLFGDIVLPSGFPETPSAMLTVPAGMSSAALAPDDASAFPQPLNWVRDDQVSMPGDASTAMRGDLLGPDYKLPDGYTMHWDAPAPLTANQAYSFRFTLLDAAGKPATDTVPYLGMAGHAAFVKTDGTVFAHTHPDGSAAMPAMMLANGGGMRMEADAPSTNSATVPANVAFPYGFPSAGRYRIFVQMKHGTTVETGVFDAQVR